MKKNALSLISIILCFLLVFTGCGSKNSSKKSSAKKPPQSTKNSQKKPKPQLSLGLVTDMTGVKGNNINSMLNDSLQKLSQAQKGKYYILQPHNKVDYNNDLNDITNVGAKLVFVVGDEAIKPVEQAAIKHPNNIFCLIDGAVNKPNVVSIGIKHNEGGFLAGITAASATHSKILGFIGDAGSTSQKEYEAGYRAGIMAVNAKIKVLSSYIEPKDKPDKIINKTVKINKSGADIIFTPSLKNAPSITKASKLTNFWIIPVSNGASKSASKNILCSVNADLSKIIKNVTKKYSSNKLKGIQIYSLGIKDKVLDIKDDQKNIPPDIKKTIEKYKKEVQSNKINLPKSDKDIEQFKKSLEKEHESSKGKNGKDKSKESKSSGSSKNNSTKEQQSNT